MERHGEAWRIMKSAGPCRRNRRDPAHIAYVYQNMGDYETSITYLKLCLEQNMENQDALYELAFCYDVLDNQQESVLFYQQYIDNEPYSYAAWYNLGDAFTKLSLFEKAIDAYVCYPDKRQLCISLF